MLVKGTRTVFKRFWPASMLVKGPASMLVKGTRTVFKRFWPFR